MDLITEIHFFFLKSVISVCLCPSLIDRRGLIQSDSPQTVSQSNGTSGGSYAPTQLRSHMVGAGWHHCRSILTLYVLYKLSRHGGKNLLDWREAEIESCRHRSTWMQHLLCTFHPACRLLCTFDLCLFSLVYVLDNLDKIVHTNLWCLSVHKLLATKYSYYRHMSQSQTFLSRLMGHKCVKGC